MSKWDRHCSTDKHKRLQKQEKTINVFSCKLCDYTTVFKHNYDRHVSTSKHARLQTMSKKAEHSCTNCNKTYKHHSSLWKHKQLCVSLEEGWSSI